jgi:mRNA-degrading endonuclease YafQ of YafQ-DinJ toxin-antitoxin module
MFEIVVTQYARKAKLLKKNSQLAKVIDKAFDKLKNNPFEISLKTHKVNSKNFGLKFASRINGDLRFIWDFNDQTSEIEIIEILDIGGHDGGDGVY